MRTDYLRFYLQDGGNKLLAVTYVHNEIQSRSFENFLSCRHAAAMPMGTLMSMLSCELPALCLDLKVLTGSATLRAAKQSELPHR